LNPGKKECALAIIEDKELLADLAAVAKIDAAPMILAVIFLRNHA